MMIGRRATDNDELDAAWQRYEPGLRRYFRRRVPPMQVDDLLQEVWVRLCSMRDRSSILDMERYLFVVASSVLSRQHRRAPPEDELDVEGIDRIASDEVSPERSLMGKERIAAAIRVLNELPERTRHVFVLHRFEEMTYQRIARDLGVSVSAVEKHMMKALKALANSDAVRG